MKAFWHYTCDFGHSWTIFRDEDSTESPEDTVCPHGHEAVTLRKARMLDMVQVAVRAAAQTVDKVTGRVGHEYEYHVVVTDVHRNMERMSRKRFNWEEAKAAMDRFRLRADRPGMVSPARAWEIMDVMDLDRSS